MSSIDGFASFFFCKPRKKFVLLWLFILTGSVTVLIPTFLHDAGQGCSQWEEYAAGIAALSHLQTYHPNLVFWGYTLPVGFDKYRVWELFAILQAAGFSIILLIEPPEKEGIKKIVVLLCLVVFFSGVALYTLGRGAIEPYQYSLFAVLLAFILCDFWMWRISDDFTYKLLLFFVDTPIFASYSLVVFHVGIPVQSDYAHFFSGAIAFQLILGNTLILLFRAHRTIADPGIGVLGTLKRLAVSTFRGA